MDIQAKQQIIANSEITLNMCANPEYLSVARAAVRAVTGAIGMDKETAERITVATVEAITNVIKHSYGGPCEKNVVMKLGKIKCNGNTDALEIVIRDFGKQVDPEKIKSRDLDDVRPGGLGVHIMQSSMDEVEFTPAEDCGMRLRMVKYLN
jgi:anti-sigma regulatory factor (Ser/Thr protein kinase)